MIKRKELDFVTISHPDDPRRLVMPSERFLHRSGDQLLSDYHLAGGCHRHDGSTLQREIARSGRQARNGAFGNEGPGVWNTLVIGTSGEPKTVKLPKAAKVGDTLSDVLGLS